jgi:hypothetical protein
MKHLRTIDCLEAEETILGGSPAEAAALLAGGASAVQAHLAGCASCRALAEDLALLAAAPPVEAPPALCERTIAAAGAELRAVRREARRAVRRAALRIALITAICLPLSLAWAVTVWRFGAAWLAPLLPDLVLSLVGGAFALACLAALSALAFTLTLIAGAAARPPRAAAFT